MNSEEKLRRSLWPRISICDRVRALCSERMLVNKFLVISGLLLIVAASAAFIVAQCFKMSGRPLFGATKSNTPSFDRPPIKAVMIRGFRDNNTSLLGKIGTALQENEVPWKDVQCDSNEFVMLAKELETFSPSKGESDSWKSLTGQLSRSAIGLANAAQKQDREATNAERQKILTTCSACNDIHR
jgi:hypothetical protein